MSIEAVLFDLDDTLIRRSMKKPEDLHRVLNQKNISVSLEEVRRACCRLESELQESLGYKLKTQRGKVPHSTLYRIWKSYFYKALGIEAHKMNGKHEIDLGWADICDTEIYPDVIPFLANLKSQGIRVGIISNAYEREVEQILEIAGLDREFFDIIVGPDTASSIKPEPEIFLHVLRILGVEPAHAIYVGNDLERDYVGAEEVGMKSFLILRSENEKVNENVRLIRNLTSLKEQLD